MESTAIKYLTDVCMSQSQPQSVMDVAGTKSYILLTRTSLILD